GARVSRAADPRRGAAPVSRRAAPVRAAEERPGAEEARYRIQGLTRPICLSPSPRPVLRPAESAPPVRVWTASARLTRPQTGKIACFSPPACRVDRQVRGVAVHADAVCAHFGPNGSPIEGA